MRGDSLRDLYAKTLALLGLGVLAGTGALVDYWPSVRLPAVESSFAQPEMSLALAVPDQPFALDLRVASARPSYRRGPLVSPAVNMAEFIPETTLVEFPEAINGDVIQTVALSRPAVLSPLVFAEEESLGPIGEEVSLSEPSESWTESTLSRSSAPVALSAADDRGMISGAVKATKSSLVLTGRKTGASIVGAFRVVSGAVRKALPNFQTRQSL